MKLLCPECGAYDWFVNTHWEGQPYMQREVCDSLECFSCDTVFDIA